MNNRMVVFSDVQGNSLALKAMFDWLAELPDFETLDFICLGDVACGYAPNTVLDMLREHDVRCIKGNMDDVILNPEPYTGDDADEKRYKEMDFWASEQLTNFNREWLSRISAPFNRNISNTKYFFAHGNASDYDVALKHDMSQNELSRHLSGDYQVFFTGHTHQAFMLPVHDKILINPGSIGFPDPLFENGKRPLKAQFVIVDEGRFEFIRLDYRVAEFSFAVMHSGMPHASWYLSQWDI